MALVFNYLAVFIAAIVSLVFGWFWYAPFMFGKKYTAEEKKKIPRYNMSIYFVTALVAVFVLSNLLAMVSAVTIGNALFLGFLVWLGFFATARIGAVLWSGKSWNYYLVNIAHDLINLLIITAILFAL